MFVRSVAAEALDRKKDLFSVYDRVDTIDNDWPGALPTAEYARADGIRIPLGVTWQNREQARHWAVRG